MGKPTDNDWNAFESERRESKINVLYYYICERNGNMDAIAKNVLGDYSSHASQRVSVITRCYGFEGNNQGKFAKMGVTREDVAAFVNQYPDGAFYDGKGSVMEEFLRKRVALRKGENDYPMDDRINDFTNYPSNRRSKRNSLSDRKKSKVVTTQSSDKDKKDEEIGVIIFGIIVVIALIYIFRKSLLNLVLDLVYMVGPIAIVVALLYFAFKYMFGKKQERKKKVPVINLIIAGILFIVGIGGFLNGGNIIIVLIFCVMGAVMLKR